jgi:hypothetical protein
MLMLPPNNPQQWISCGSLTAPGARRDAAADATGTDDRHDDGAGGAGGCRWRWHRSCWSAPLTASAALGRPDRFDITRNAAASWHSARPHLRRASVARLEAEVVLGR